MRPGDTFLYRHPGQNMHLMVVLCKTKGDPLREEILHCVYLTTFYNSGDEDAVCLFLKGDHPFIHHDSYVEYSQLLHICADYLQTQEAIGRAVQKDPITADQLEKIKSAAHSSEAIHPKDLKYFL